MVLVVGAAHMTQRGEDRDYNLKKDSVTAKKLHRFITEIQRISQRVP